MNARAPASTDASPTIRTAAHPAATMPAWALAVLGLSLAPWPATTVFALGDGPLAPGPIVLELTPDSAYTTGCFPPCLCPIRTADGVKGTLAFRLTESNPLFDTYAVEADLTVPGDPLVRLVGAGTYKVGGEVALAQEMELDLAGPDGALERYKSGTVPEGGLFPGALAVEVSIGTRECFDTILDLRAKPAASQHGGFVRADCNADDKLDLSDPVSGLLFLFAGATRPPCLDACDSNDDGKLDLSDAVKTLNYLFLGGEPPPAPAAACGEDPTGDDLDCQAYAPCTASCEDEVSAIAKETQLVGSCSAVVRLDYLTRSILGWQLVCGKYAQVTEDAARKTAEADTGYGAGKLVGSAGPADLYVFYEPPGDFGGVGAVSARTGLSVFGGAIVWDGAGDITYPLQWRSPESLGVDCEPFASPVEARGHDLAEGGTDLPEDLIAAALDPVRSTALLEGMATSGYVFDAVVLLYPRSVGVFDPTTAEWIVIVNGGWLE